MIPIAGAILTTRDELDEIIQETIEKLVEVTGCIPSEELVVDCCSKMMRALNIIIIE